MFSTFFSICPPAHLFSTGEDFSHCCTCFLPILTNFTVIHVFPHCWEFSLINVVSVHSNLIVTVSHLFCTFGTFFVCARFSQVLHVCCADLVTSMCFLPFTHFFRFGNFPYFSHRSTIFCALECQCFTSLLCICTIFLWIHTSSCASAPATRIFCTCTHFPAFTQLHHVFSYVHVQTGPCVFCPFYTVVSSMWITLCMTINLR